MRTRARSIAAYGVLVVAVGAAGGLAWTQVKTQAAAPQSNTRTVTVQTGTVSQTVSATGNLEPASSTVVAFQTSGKVIEVDVQAGQTVTAGQVLGKLDPSTAQTNLEVAQLNYNAAAQKLTSAQAGTTTSGGGASGSGASSSAATTTVDSAAVYSAQASLIQSQTSLDNAKAALAATTLVAPVGGLVTVVNNVVGDTAGSSSAASTSSSSGSSGSSGAAGSSGASGAGGAATGATAAASSSSASSSSGFVTIVDPTSYQVKVAFPEADAVKVKVDQPATVTVDAIAGTTLTGKVATVDPLATVTSNVVTYKSIISVANPPPTLKAGMTVTVAVTTASKADVVAVSTAAITTQGGASFVMKLVNGTPTRTDVVVGLQGDSTTEITSGLSAGDQVSVATGTISTSNTQTTRQGQGAGGLGGGGFTPGGGGGGFPGGGQRGGG